jgi:hypothetical protein
VWAVTQHSRGAHDEGGVVIHATPKSKRIEYARRIADLKASRHNFWPFGEGQALGSRVYHGRARGAAKRSAPKLTAKQDVKARREQEAERVERKLTDRDLNAKLSRHYAGGGNLAEFLQSNPGLRPLAKLYREYEKLVQRIGPERDTKRLQSLIDQRDGVAKELARLGFPVNPGSGAFERCVEDVEAKGGAYDPRAVCAAAGRRKYGAKKFAAMAQAGKRQAADNPAQTPPAYVYPSERSTGRWSVGIPGSAVETRKSKRGAIAWAERLRKSGAVREVIVQSNPSDAAAEMYRKFHGRLSGEVVEVEKPLHYHAHLAALGELEKLTVRAHDGGLVDLEGFGDAVLCSNERGTQLYIEGGDQAVKLAAFGIGKPYHDIEDLGEVVKLWYFTTKDHLGDQGGEASYHHKLSEENSLRMQQSFGEKRAPKPRLMYDTLNQALAFAGGEYSVEPEGIRN